MKNRREVAITGIGMVSAFGTGAEPFWKSISGGACGVRKVSGFPVDSDLYLCKIAAEAAEIDPSPWVPGTDETLKDRYACMALPVLSMALQDGGYECGDLELRSADLYMGSAQETGDALDAMMKSWFAGMAGSVPRDAYSRTDPHSVTTAAARLFGIGGRSFTVTASCMSGMAALMMAYLAIKGGESELALVVGADVLSPSIFLGQGLTGELSRRNHDPARAARPFDSDQDGQVVGDGGVALVLETAARARARGAEKYGTIGPLATTTDGTSFKYIDKKGSQIARGLSLLLDKVPAEEIGYVNAHGPSIRALDIAESQAIRRVFGKLAEKVPVTSIKGATGNPAGAGGLMQVVTALMSMRDGLIPPTLNLDNPMPECDLDYVRKSSRKADLGRVLVSTHGGGGVNLSLIVQH